MILHGKATFAQGLKLQVHFSDPNLTVFPIIMNGDGGVSKNWQVSKLGLGNELVLIEAEKLLSFALFGRELGK